MDVNLYNKALEFMKNKHALEAAVPTGPSNLYVIERVDSEGNVLETKFGENVLTDYGFQQYFVSKAEFPKNVYVGDGIDPVFDKGSRVLQSAISDVALTNTNTTIDYACPFYFQPSQQGLDNGLITVFCQYIQTKMVYENSAYGIQEDSRLITEFGIGSSVSNLWTHSRVYDTQGSPSSVRKNNNEELIFTIFLCVTYPESLIKNGWRDSRSDTGSWGTYSVITTPQRFFRERMYPANIYTFKIGGKTSRTKTDTNTNIEDSRITINTEMSSFLLTDDYFDGFASVDAGFVTVEREEMVTPEAIDKVFHPLNPGSTTDNDLYGNRDRAFDELSSLRLGSSGFRFSQMNVNSCALYDYHSHDWVNYVHSDSGYSSNKWYDEMGLSKDFAVAIHYMATNNTIATMYVHQNMNPQDPILAVTSGQTVIYFAEKYWDTSTWVNITTPNNIPVALRNYKYILTGDNNVDVKVKRGLPSFPMLPYGGKTIRTYSDFVKHPTANTDCITVSNYQYGWFKLGNNLYVPDTGRTYTVPNSNPSVPGMTYDKWFIDVTNGNNVNYVNAYDMTGMNSMQSPPDNMPTPYQIIPNFSQTVYNIFQNTYRTESGTGLICFCDIAINESVIIDLNSWNSSTNTFDVNYRIASGMCCCIANTNYIAYIPYDQQDSICIYDMTGGTPTLYRTMSLPSGVTPIIICGLNNSVWVSNNTTAGTLVYDIITGTYSTCNMALPWNSARENLRFTFVDDVMVGYYINIPITTNNTLKTYCLTDANPSTIISLNSVACNWSAGNGYPANYYLTKIQTATNNNTLALVMSTITYYASSWSAVYYFHQNYVFDLGKFIDDPNHAFTYNIDNIFYDASAYINSYGVYVPYGPYVFVDNRIRVPIEYFMPYRVIGSTHTIGTTREYKQINGKRFAVTVSNTPAFNGLPPGTRARL